MHSEFEPTLNQTIVQMPIGMFVVELGLFFPAQPLTKSMERTIELTEQALVSDLSAEKLTSITHKIDAIIASISLALINYKDN